jgi:hypothetical protein
MYMEINDLPLELNNETPRSSPYNLLLERLFENPSRRSLMCLRVCYRKSSKSQHQCSSVLSKMPATRKLKT